MKGGKVLVSSGLPRDSFPNLTPPASGKVEFLGCFSFLKLSKTTKEPISLANQLCSDVLGAVTDMHKVVDGELWLEIYQQYADQHKTQRKDTNDNSSNFELQPFAQNVLNNFVEDVVAAIHIIQQEKQNILNSVTEPSELKDFFLSDLPAKRKKKSSSDKKQEQNQPTLKESESQNIFEALPNETLD